MIKEAIERILDLAAGEVLHAHGKAYSRFELKPLPSPEPEPKPLTFHTLSGFAAFVTKQHGVDFETCMIHVVDHAHVELRDDLSGEFKQRACFAAAKPFPLSGFPFGRMMGIEEFVVGLQSCFVQDEKTAKVLSVVGNVKAEQVTTVVDDGVSQEVTALAGVAHVARIVVPNPVQLRPFRTFQEIEQPSSCFVLRMKREGESGYPTVGLFEVVDNFWQVCAVGRIEAFLKGLVKDVPIFI